MIVATCRYIYGKSSYYRKTSKLINFASVSLTKHLGYSHSTSSRKVDRLTSNITLQKRPLISKIIAFRKELTFPRKTLTFGIDKEMSSMSKTDDFLSKSGVNIGGTETGPIEASIRSKLEQSMSPMYIQIINESYMHNVPKNSETHFKLIIVSDQFETQSLVQRHRTIHSLLKEELEGGVHALSMVLKTPEQWSKIENNPEQLQKYKSPPCAGGSGK